MHFIHANNCTPRTLITCAYALACYLASLAALAMFIVFSSGLYIELSVNNPTSQYKLLTAIFINLILLSLFGLQHSLMARKCFKKRFKMYLSTSIERSTYCLATSVILLIIVFNWQPLDGMVWDLSDSVSGLFLTAIGASGWLILLIASFQIDHFELFGLRQGVAPLIGQPLNKPSFKKIGLYKIARHPIQLGVLIGLWFVPQSTPSHIMLASGMTLYIVIGLYFEEKDLIKEFGQTYHDYKKQVAKLIPFWH